MSVAYMHVSLVWFQKRNGLFLRNQVASATANEKARQRKFIYIDSSLFHTQGNFNVLYKNTTKVQ